MFWTLYRNYRISLYNNKDLEILESLIHYDYELLAIPSEVHPHKPGQLFLKFVRLLDIDIDISYWSREKENKDGFLKFILALQTIFTDMTVNWIIAENDIVFLHVNSIINNSKIPNIIHNSFIQIEFKDNQIFSYTGIGRYLNTIIQYGDIVIKRNNKEELELYMQNLREIGIIPEK